MTDPERRGGPLRSGALTVLLALSGLPMGAQTLVDVRYRIEQPSQALSESLRSIAKQASVSVLFDPGAVNSLMSRPVSGHMSAIEAIQRALEGSGLVTEVMKDGAIVIRRVAPPAADPNAPPRTVHTPSMAPGPGNSPSDHSEIRDSRASSPAGGAIGAGLVAGPQAALPKAQTIEVTGSRLKRVEAEGPQPVNTYTKADIDRSGQPTLERFLNSLNEVSVSAGEGAVGATTGQGTVQLRGLPLGSTLVLLNGRRLQAVGSSSANFFNLNLIPLAAVERVEIVPVGSSAVYGGDALAGVVNIILKKSIDGFAMTARLGSGKDIGDGGVSIATGAADAEGSYLILSSFNKSSPLTMAEREFFRDADYRRFGGPDVRMQYCTPGTVTSSTGANLPGLNSTIAGIPLDMSTPTLGLDRFAGTAGVANLCSVLANGKGYALVHGTQAVGLHATAERRLGRAWSVFGELSYANDRLHAEEAGLSFGNVLVPATNPYNPFGTPVRVTTMLGPANGMQEFERRTRLLRVLGGLRGEFGGGWDAELTVSTSRDAGHRIITNNIADSAPLGTALAASSPATALNPFTAGRAASDAVLHAIWSDAIRESRGRKDQMSGFVRGPVADLPGGPVAFIAGAEFARDEYETAIPGQLNALDARHTSALYAELRAPLLRAERTDGRAWNMAAVTVAGRHDRYSDFGSASTYQAGIELRPAHTVLLRASTATSFKPPTLLQTNIDDAALPAAGLGLVDPARNNEPIVVGEVMRTTNRQLAPERGRALSLGAVWGPDISSGTRLGLSAWRVKIDNLIALLWPQTALNHESMFPGFVARGLSVDGMQGQVQRVLYTEVNYGGVQTAGADFEASRSWQGPAGRWRVSAVATRTSQYRVVLAPGAPVQDRLGRRFIDYWAPRWKGQMSASLDRGAWSVGITSRHLGSYRDAGISERRLGNTWIHDLAGTLDLKMLGTSFTSVVKSAKLAVGIVNVADRQPQFVETTPYYDVTMADWRGRYLSALLSVDW